jgi:hypothetical protein
MRSSINPILAVILLTGLALAQNDKYGGLIAKPCSGGATGEWHAQTMAGRWVICDPLGNALWSKGVYGVNPAFLKATASKYGSNAAWASNAAARIKSWGFNFLPPYAADDVLPWATDPSYPLDRHREQSIPTKIPTFYIVRPGLYGMNMNATAIGSSIKVGIKDLMNGRAPKFVAYGAYIPTNGVPDYGDMNRYLAVLDYMLNTDPRPSQLPDEKDSPHIDYLAGIAVEDSDQTWGLGSGEAFETFPPGRQQWHLSWNTASMSPIQQVHSVKGLLYNADTQVYIKSAWKNFLIAKYGTIEALNKAWGSSYTTFGSTASIVSNETLFTTDGTNYSFSHKLANAGAVAPNSIQVLDSGGAMLGGDCYHPSATDTCNPEGGLGNGGIYGPSMSGGKIVYGTKILTVVYSGIFHNYLDLTCSTSSCVGTFHYYDDTGAGVGDKVTIRDSSCCQFVGTGTVTAKSAIDGGGNFTLTFSRSGKSVRGTWAEGERGMIAKVKIPAAGTTLKANYQVNGWNSGGTGLMDEDGSHPWMGTDIIALSNTNPRVAADMRSFLYQTAHQYFSGVRAKVKAAIPHAMYVGPDSLSTWGVPTRKEVLQAAAQLDGLDLAILGGASTGESYTQEMIDYTVRNFGKPGIMATFHLANADSPYSSNFVSYSKANQSVRGAAFAGQIRNAIKARSAFGPAPWVGYWWWQYTDNTAEGNNWGLVTIKDNAYDGHEAVTSTVACSSPINNYNCGGEAGNYGNVIAPVISANADIDRAIADSSSNSAAPARNATPPRGGSNSKNRR